MSRANARSWVLLAIAYLGFVSLGLPDTVLGVAWPSVRDAFDLPQAAVGLIFFGGGFGYFLTSFFAGRLSALLGIGLLLAVSSAFVATSAFGYATALTWTTFAAFSLLHGLGSGAIDAGLNHFAAHNFSARHMNWLHACYSLGATLGPVIMTSVLAQERSWRTGYLVVALALASLTVLFVITRRRWNAEPTTTDPLPPARRPSLVSVLGVPLVWLQILIFFVYTGLELTIGQWTYTFLTESRHVSETRAGTLVAAYWSSILAGRVVFGFVVERLGIDRLLRLGTTMALIGAAMVMFSRSEGVTAAGLVLAGLGLAPIYPCLMTRTPERLGHDLSTHAIGFQVSAAMLGGAALPSVTGLLAQYQGLRAVPAAALVMAFTTLCLHEMLLRQPAGAESGHA